MVDETANQQPKAAATNTKKDDIPPAAPATTAHKVGAILALPGNVTVTFPLAFMVIATIVALNAFTQGSLGRLLLTTHFGWNLPMGLGMIPQYVGLIFLGTGLILLYTTAKKFFDRGVAINPHPTEAFLTDGIYAYMRDPMITGVELMLIGEAIMFGSFVVLGGMLLIFVPIMHLGILPRDHKRNQRTFAERYKRGEGEQWNPARYDAYHDNVKAWPRLTFKGGKLRFKKYTDTYVTGPVTAKAA